MSFFGPKAFVSSAMRNALTPPLSDKRTKDNSILIALRVRVRWGGADKVISAMVRAHIVMVSRVAQINAGLSLSLPRSLI